MMPFTIIMMMTCFAFLSQIGKFFKFETPTFPNRKVFRIWHFRRCQNRQFIRSKERELKEWTGQIYACENCKEDLYIFYLVLNVHYIPILKKSVTFFSIQFVPLHVCTVVSVQLYLHPSIKRIFIKVT